MVKDIDMSSCKNVENLGNTQRSEKKKGGQFEKNVKHS